MASEDAIMQSKAKAPQVLNHPIKLTATLADIVPLVARYRERRVRALDSQGVEVAP